MLENKKILLAVSGSIAAYKTAQLTRLLVKAGAEVKVIMTPSATNFITPLTLSTLSRNPVLINLFDEDAWHNHALLGRWADLMIVAPLSCNTLSKMATGQCDNLLLAVYLSATCKVMVAPAMDEDMWKHPSTQHNLSLLQSYGNEVIPVNSGELASGLTGEGRMAEPEQILHCIQQHFQKKNDLSGKKVLITAGPTYEAIDPVRFIGNHSSGKMGVALAREMRSRGADVTLVLGPSSLYVEDTGIALTRVISADQMYKACMSVADQVDIMVMSAAVADFTPVVVAQDKIKKKEQSLSIELTQTKDILKTLGEKKKPGQFLVGFALETSNEVGYAKKKLKEKNADMIVLNSLRDEGAGFGSDTNKVTVFTSSGEVFPFSLQSKAAIANEIVNLIVKATDEN